MNLKVLAAWVLVGTGMLFMCSNKNIAGSVTETGNVTGKVVFKDSKASAAGARIAFFKTKYAILSPSETFAPDMEIYADADGCFSADIDDGTYSMLVSDDKQRAFVEHVVPGTNDARGMTVTLQESGTIKGAITNALDLRESGSVVVRVMGTDIFQLVDKNGNFSLENAPAGRLTIVSYTTSTATFSPLYQDLTIVADSVHEVGAYELNYIGIPIPKGVKIAYDLEKQTVGISWQPVTGYDDFQEFGILRGIAGRAEHDLKQVAYTNDTVYRDRITFSSADSVIYEYAIRVSNKLGQYGTYYGIYAVSTAPYQSPVDAGADRTVDIGTEVVLRGTVVYPKSPIVKMEWKIGTAPWVKSDSGEGKFTTGTTLATDTTVCVFRVTDSLENILSDTVLIRKEMLITVYGSLPGRASDSNGFPKIAKLRDKYWYISGSATTSYSSWSTIDFSAWSIEKTSCPITNSGDVNGEFVAFKEQLFILNLDSNYQDYPQEKSYRSDNGRDWNEITIIPPSLKSAGFDSSYTGTDFFHLQSHIVGFHSKLFALLEVSAHKADNTGSFDMKLVTSSDGITWTCIGTIPGFDYRYTYILFPNNDNLYFVSLPGGLRYGERFKHKEIYRSADEGVTWVKDVLWDTDEAAGPDPISFVIASNSMIFANYYENGITETESFLLNGRWNTLPPEVVEKQQFHSSAFIEQANLNGWRGLGVPSWLAGNKFYWVDPGYVVKSIKLF